ncbi:lytic transglycosylase domain-containing protein [Streptosporangium carneum]|uniref:Lytic transglycosylase domain-containing protein n=1 Tax=Streptosporangium carneum TaxID=47481 RepID=A0A9W6MDP7_9ACTN|nr:lytic transglycosylase domain-containing protein [Streptosporangium carneum]GLK10719.1 hypothetical protein GCM10017600_41250 [Streptosporangium carneum]
MRKRFAAVVISLSVSIALPALSAPAYAENPVGENQRIAKSMMSSWGWRPSSHFDCLVRLWGAVSGWRETAGTPSGAYGIPWANPGKLMASAGSDWKTNATTQIKWGFSYIKGKYSTPCGAWSHYQSHGSY